MTAQLRLLPAAFFLAKGHASSLVPGGTLSAAHRSTRFLESHPVRGSLQQGDANSHLSACSLSTARSLSHDSILALAAQLLSASCPTLNACSALQHWMIRSTSFIISSLRYTLNEIPQTTFPLKYYFGPLLHPFQAAVSVVL